MSGDNELSRLVDCAREAAAAGHGGKAGVYQRYCRELGWLKPDGSANVQRLLRALGAAGLCPRRARRSDAGAHTLAAPEAEAIVRWQRENARGKGGCRPLVSLKNAVDTLRSNGIIRAEYLDADSGELRPLSYSAIAAAIRAYGLDAKTLAIPAPAMRMRVLHANHVWQVDASLCVLYYLPASGGLQVMNERDYNDNKPKNIKRIENERVTRYVVVDVASGCIYVEYVFGGESGANLTQVFINAMQQRRNEFWGVPKRVYCDAGSANTGAVFKGLCQALGIDLQWHMPGNARATGAVEKAQDIVERNFESMLAARPVYNLADLNRAAALWRVKFNATAVHTRHGGARLAAWAKHVAGYLTAPPGVDVCRAVAHTKPLERTVTQDLTINFDGKEWNAKALPGVYHTQKVQIVKNPWSEDSIRIVRQAADGRMEYFECPLIRLDTLGYPVDSAIMGEQFKRHARTGPELTLERLAKQTAADQAMAPTLPAARGSLPPEGALPALGRPGGRQAQAPGGKRAKPVPFGGKVDPFKPLADAYMPEQLPRRPDAVHPLGELLTAYGGGLVAPPAVHVVLTLPEAVRAIKERLGEAAPVDLYSQVKAAWPAGGVPQEWAQAWAAPLPATGTHGAPAPLRRVK